VENRSLKKKKSKKGSDLRGAGDLGMNGQVGYGYGNQTRRGSGFRPQSASRLNPAYDYDDYDPRESRSRSGFSRNIPDYGDSYSQGRRTSKFSADNYDDGMDYIGMGASMSHDDRGGAPTGRLPPLEGVEDGVRKKKKKKGMLKKHRQLQDAEDLL
jgi:hypothetical protein